jgi:hypothetical protein
MFRSSKSAIKMGKMGGCIFFGEYHTRFIYIHNVIDVSWFTMLQEFSHGFLNMKLDVCRLDKPRVHHYLSN